MESVLIFVVVELFIVCVSLIVVISVVVVSGLVSPPVIGFTVSVDDVALVVVVCSDVCTPVLSGVSDEGT